MANPTLTESNEEKSLCLPPILTPQSEQELPPSQSKSRSSPTETIPPSKVDEIERQNRVKKAEQEIHLKDNAFVLLCFCIGSFIFFYVFDTVVLNFGWKTSEVLTSAIDMAKTVITFLLGYLFATEKPKN